MYHQTEAMCRIYQNPVLLIEFDKDKAFSLQHPNEIGSVCPYFINTFYFILFLSFFYSFKLTFFFFFFLQEILSSNIISKLVLLTSHFPRLRMFWCRSPHITAELFELVKVSFCCLFILFYFFPFYHYFIICFI